MWKIALTFVKYEKHPLFGPALDKINLQLHDLNSVFFASLLIVLSVDHFLASLGFLSEFLVDEGDFFTGDFHTEGITFLGPDLVEAFGESIQRFQNDSRVKTVYPAHGRYGIQAEEFFEQAQDAFDLMKTTESVFNPDMKCWCYHCKGHIFALY